MSQFTDWLIDGIATFSTKTGVYLKTGSVFGGAEDSITVRPVSQNTKTGTFTCSVQRKKEYVDLTSGVAVKRPITVRLVIEADQMIPDVPLHADAMIADLSSNLTPENLGKIFLGGV